MKEIILKQYVEVRRVVAVRVDDDCTAMEAAEMLDQMSLVNAELPDNARVVDDWIYISDTGIEDENGVTILHSEEEDVDRG